jgi:hypothetical protein
VSQVYVVSGAVNQALQSLREDLKREVKFHVSTAQSASARYWEQVRKIMANPGAYVETHAEGMARIECEFCSTVHTIRRNVLHYSCSCRPHVIQHAFKNALVAGEK